MIIIKGTIAIILQLPKEILVFFLWASNFRKVKMLEQNEMVLPQQEDQQEEQHLLVELQQDDQQSQKNAKVIANVSPQPPPRYSSLIGQYNQPRQEQTRYYYFDDPSIEQQEESEDQQGVDVKKEKPDRPVKMFNIAYVSLGVTILGILVAVFGTVFIILRNIRFEVFLFSDENYSLYFGKHLSKLLGKKKKQMKNLII